MADKDTLYFVKSDDDVNLFWERRDSYMREDILPNSTFHPAVKVEYDWFFSQEYREHIMRLFHREVDPLRMVFFQHNSETVGFAVYVTYHSEDGKCFILDFCIYSEYRNKGLGGLFFNLLRKHTLMEKATYFALNLSNEHNQRFWRRNGFVAAYKDEYGNEVYENHAVWT